MDAYKIENKHGIILYYSIIAGVELEDQEETEDPPAEEDQNMEGAPSFEENQEFDAQPTQEINQMQEENNIEENDEEALQGTVQPTVRRSSRVTAKRAVLNTGEKNTKTYDAQMNQAESNDIEYDMMEEKLFAMVITQIRQKIRCQCQEVQSQHVITYSLSKGMKKFGSQAEEAAMKEMEQMIERDCFEPIHREEYREKKGNGIVDLFD
jgi:hypothetical protein